MLWLRSAHFSLRNSLSKSHISIWILSLKQSTHAHVLYPNQEQLLSLLYKHRSLLQSRQVHCQLITSGSCCYLIDKTGMMIWNTLLREYSLGNFPEDALQLYQQLQGNCSSSVPTDSFTFSFLLKACANLLEPMKGIQIHGHTIKVGFEFHVYVQTALINMYSVCRFLSEARRVFDHMFLRNLVTWNVMITGLTRWGENLNVGKSIHGLIKKNHFSTSDIRVNNALIDMYAKCGCIENSFGVFYEISETRNLVSWTSMISALALHGMSREAVNQFKEMKELGLKPNSITFLSVLNACSHGGMVEEGLHFFSDMVNKYGIAPEIKHYGCIIDMLGRSGRLEEAEKLLIEMPMKENVIVWRTLLGACSFHGNTEMGERVMAKILEMEKEYGGDYVLYYNILAGAGRYDDAERVRRCMDERNVLKIPGFSLIDGRKS